MNKGITVSELFAECKQLVDQGFGDRHILISDDDEGNGFHTLFYSFATDEESINAALEIEHDKHFADEVVVLG